jgi:hypothetical protein
VSCDTLQQAEVAAKGNGRQGLFGLQPVFACNDLFFRAFHHIIMDFSAFQKLVGNLQFFFSTARRTGWSSTPSIILYEPAEDNDRFSAGQYTCRPLWTQSS